MKFVYMSDPAYALRKRRYHPFAEYHKAIKRFEKNMQAVPGGKFHKLARKLEAMVPRGLRHKGDIEFSTTAILLEVINEEKAQRISKH